jgi:hypothetical protein
MLNADKLGITLDLKHPRGPGGGHGDAPPVRRRT